MSKMQNRAHCLRIFQLLAISFAWCLSAVPSLAKQPLVDKARGFQLTLPDGFRPIGDLRSIGRSYIHGYTRPDPIQPGANIFLLIEDMGTETEKDISSIEQLPPDARKRASTVTWQGLDLIAMEEKGTVGDSMGIGYSTIVPLKGSAIRLGVVGPAVSKMQVRRLFEDALANLQGESNWNSGPEWVSLLFPFYNNRKALLTIGSIAAIAAGIFFLWLISSHAASKATMLGLSALIWCGGWKIGGQDADAWILMIGGCMQIIGSISFLIGLCGLFRKRKPRPKKMTSTGWSGESSPGKPQW